MKIPTELIPHCPVCGKPITMNLRADDTLSKMKVGIGRMNDTQILSAGTKDSRSFFRTWSWNEYAEYHKISFLVNDLQ